MFENFQYGKFGEVKCWEDKKYLRKFKTKTTFDFSSMSYLQLHPSTQPIFYRVEIFELFMGVKDLSLPPSPRAAPAGEELIRLKSSKISTQYLIASSYSLGIASCTVVGELHTSYNGSSVQRDDNNNIHRKCGIIKATWSHLVNLSMLGIEVLCNRGGIDKLHIYPDGKSFSSSVRIEPFAVLFWAFGILLTPILKQLTQPAGLTSLNSGNGPVQYSSGKLGLI